MLMKSFLRRQTMHVDVKGHNVKRAIEALCSYQFKLCPFKTSTFLFLNKSQKLTDLNNFWYIKS